MDAKESFNSQKPLRIAILEGYSPYTLIGPTGEATGLVVEMWRVWSRVTGTPVEFVPSGWQETLKALRSGKVDVHFGMFKNESRLVWADFVEPIHQIHTSLFFRANEDTPLSLDQLTGEKVGVGAGTYQLQFLKDSYPEVEVVPVNDSNDLALMLLKGEVRAILNEVPSVEAALAMLGVRGLLARDPKSQFANYLQPAVRKGERELLDHINDGFRKIPTAQLNKLENMWIPNQSDHFFAGAGGKIEFSEEEKAWLAKNPAIKLAVTTFIQPVDIIDGAGNYSGLNADLIDLFNRTLGVNIVPEFFDTWGGVVKAATEGTVDGAFSLSITPEREKNILFSKPYAFDPIIAIVPRSRTNFESWNDLDGKTVTVVKGAAIIEEVLEMIGDGVLVEVESEKDGLKAVSYGSADVHVSWLLPYGNSQREDPIDGLKIALTRNSEGGTLRIGVHKDRPELLSLIRKGLNAISREEMTKVRNKWLFSKDSAGSTATELVADEKSWLQSHPIIRLAVLKDYPPFDFTNDEGKHTGLHSDLLRLINKNLGINVVTIPFDSWKEAYDKAASGEIEGIMSLGWTKERENTFLFSTPYHYDPADLVVRVAEKSIKSWRDVSGKTIWARSGSSIIDKIKKDHPSATILEDPDEENILKQLAAGKGDAYISWISASKSHLGSLALKVTAEVDTRQGELLIGTHKSRPLVASIIQKGLNAIPTKEMTALRNSWLFGEEKAVSLTGEEQVWVKSHIVKVGVEEWPPLVFLGKIRQPQGLAYSFLKKISKSTGLKFEYVGNDWNELLEDFKEKKIDLLPATYYTEERATYGLYTKPFFNMREFAYVKASNDEIRSLDDLADKRVAIIKGYGTLPKVRAKYPNMTIVETPDLLESINAVLNGQADALFESQMVIEHTIKANSIIGLKGISQTVFKASPIHFFSRIDEPLLRSILQKGFDAISEREKSVEISKWVSATETERDKLGLSSSEKKWLSEHETIRLGVDLSWPPFEFIDEDGKYSGVGSGYIDAVSKRMEIPMEAVKGLKWSEVLTGIKNGELDVLPAVTRTPERDKFLNFTSPYIKVPIVIATAKDGPLISEIDDLQGKVTGVVGGYATSELLSANHPSLGFLEMQNIGTLLKALSNGEVDAVIGNLWVISYEKDRLKLEDIKIAAPTPYSNELSMGVRKDWPELVPILDKALSSLSKHETAAIKNAWMAVEVKFGLDMKTILIWAVPIGGSALLVILFIIVWNRRLGVEVEERKKAQHAVAESHKIITDSIEYASRIQRSILPSQTFLEEDLNDHFVIWEPRDVVGGDLYWYRRVEGGFIIAVGDCTGHGVPGAFLTMIASGALDRALREHPKGDPGELLKTMNRSVQISLSQDQEVGESDDGLELGVCLIDTDRTMMRFAGGRFSLFSVQGNEISEIKGTKKGLGYRGISQNQAYDEFEIPLQKGVPYYMTSDGLIDQVGGEKRRAFGKRRFKELLLSIQGKPMHEQKKDIYFALLEFQGDEKRRDDLSAIGFTV